MSVLAQYPLGFPWRTQDPFLFCVFHEDFYPKGNGALGPDASLKGRVLGQDFTVKDGWRMYHGKKTPSFPAHPHCGFETVTVVNSGWVDHTDSLGAAGRYGNGDVQWMTAGRGVQHAEMFPLLNTETDNPLELFQIWLNLPQKDKQVPPDFKMLWSEDIPKFSEKGVSIQIISGDYQGLEAPQATSHSWATEPENEVRIWNIQLEPNTHWELPSCSAGVLRSLYFFKGTELFIEGIAQRSHCLFELDEAALAIQSGETSVRLLLLQGRPIQEPVVQYGPFVTNRESEVQQAMRDFQTGRFGTWNWPQNDPTHGLTAQRFARYPDGREVRP